MSITFYCPECRIALEADAKDLGNKVECGNCDKEIKVPQVDFSTGDKLGPYKILEIVGHGSMGIVYKAIEESMGVPVALKVLHPHLVDDEEYVEDFIKEAEVMGRVSHPNIVKAINVGEDQGYHFLAMQLVEGDTALHRLTQQDLYSEEEALTVALKIAQALGEVWEKFQLLHRDIKPSNIMVDNNGDVLLMDLGISVLANEMEENSDIVGTPYYMSPEQARGESVDLRSDMFSLGSTLYHFLTGEEPFKGGDVFEIIHHVKHSEAVAVREKNIRIGQKCSDFIARLMTKDRKARFASWGEVQETAQAIIDSPYGSPVDVAKSKKEGKKSNPVTVNKKVLLTGFATVLFVMTISLAFLVGRSSTGGADGDEQRVEIIELSVEKPSDSDLSPNLVTDVEVEVQGAVTQSELSVEGEVDETEDLDGGFEDDSEDAAEGEGFAAEIDADPEPEVEPELSEEERNTLAFEEQSSEFILHYMSSKFRSAKKSYLAMKENESFKDLIDFRLRLLAFQDLMDSRVELVKALAKLKGEKMAVYFPEGERYEEVYVHAASPSSGIYVKYKVDKQFIFKKVPYYYLDIEFCKEVYTKKVAEELMAVATSYIYYKQGKLTEASEALLEMDDSEMKVKALSVVTPEP